MRIFSSLFTKTPLPLLLLLLGSTLGWAQEESPKKPRKHGRLELPKAAPAPKPEKEKEEEQVPFVSFWDGVDVEANQLLGQDRVLEVFRRFEQLEDYPETAFKDHLDELRAFGIRTRRAALVALNAEHVPTVLLAARLLEFVGSPEDCDLLIDAAAWVGTVSGASTCLETALRLNGGWLPATGVHHLEHPQRNIRTAVESRLARGPHSSHVKALLTKLRYGRDNDVRLRSARLLQPFHEQEEVRTALRLALQDRTSSVAFQAAEALAGEGRPTQVEYLHQEILVIDPGVEMAYLLFALLLQQEKQDALILQSSLIEELPLVLGHPDMFLSGVAGAVLAEYFFRSSEDLDWGVVEQDMVSALVRSVGGLTFYPQFARFSPMAEASLRRVTGYDPGEGDRSAWVLWWSGNNAGFRAVRGTLEINPEDLPGLRIQWLRNGQWRSLGGPEVADYREETRLLGNRSLQSLLQALDQAGVLDPEVLPGIYGPGDQEISVRLDLAAGTRRKPLAFRGLVYPVWLLPLLDHLDQRWQLEQWQLLEEPQRRLAFVQERLQPWDEAESPAAKAAWKVNWSRGRLASLSAPSLRAWCRELVSDPAVETVWDLKLAQECLQQIPLRQPEEATVLALMEAGLRQPHSDLGSLFLDVANDEAVREPLRSTLLFEGLKRFAPEIAEASLSDSRLAVRVAAARALGHAGEQGFSALLHALQDPNPLVVRTAARSLGEVGNPAALDYLLPLAGPENGREVRKDALWALGRLNDLGALSTLKNASQAGDPGVRLVAIRALGELEGREVESAFRELFPLFAGSALEVSFLRSLEKRGAGAARSVLRSHLESTSVEVARRAAIHGGRLGDPAAAPFLIGLLPETPRDPEVLDALSFTLCMDFRDHPDPAGTYLSWWRIHGRKAGTAWLEMGATLAGMNLHETFKLSEGEPALLAIPSLLDLLESGPPLLRASASYYLHRWTGVDAPALYGTTPRPMVLQVAQAWHQWLDARGNG